MDQSQVKTIDATGPAAFWSLPVDALLAEVGSRAEGLTSDEAGSRQTGEAAGRRVESRARRAVGLLLGQFRSPLTLLLIVAAVLSIALRDATNAGIILTIVLVSGLLGFWQEWAAADAVSALLALVEAKAEVRRDGAFVEVPVERVVPGDVVRLNAGDVIPGDGRVLECRDLFVNEATLTGETFPVEKSLGTLDPDTPLARRTNSLFLGTSVVSGLATFLVVNAGKRTEFGRISTSLRLRPPETSFERGVRRFGYFLMEITAVLVLIIFAINVYFHRPVLESFLFALAIAVGLTPQLLPAILGVNLAHGARMMAESRVIVRRLESIENLGSMNILCSDKTGTLTEGDVRLHEALDASGEPSEVVLRHARLNAALQSGYANPIDRAILARSPAGVEDAEKLDEEPYDFVRKRLSVLVRWGDRHVMVTKGALAAVLDVCTTVDAPSGEVADLAAHREEIERRFGELGEQGYRVLGVARRDVGDAARIDRDSESAMTFLGFLVFADPLREGVAASLRSLRDLGVETKLITGDSRLVAGQVARSAGLGCTRLLTGADLRRISGDALVRLAGEVGVFAEVEPSQKERIILALKQAGHVVGYLGDGINDAPALHAADVGISVSEAADVAREAADIVLLEKSLAVLEAGVREGRATFANTIKYVFMATSANFGNMFSMAAASLFLPFLPLLPKQVLLTNLLTDLPELTIARDAVDPEMVEAPRRWDIGFISRFMMVFGLVSSVFDLMTFAFLRMIWRASPTLFRTGWFVESVVSACLIVLIVRTRRVSYRSRPGRALLAATLAVIALTVLLPYSPLAGLLGFDAPPPALLAAIGGIVLLYAATAEAAKFLFFRGER